MLGPPAPQSFRVRVFSELMNFWTILDFAATPCLHFTCNPDPHRQPFARIAKTHREDTTHTPRHKHSLNVLEYGLLLQFLAIFPNLVIFFELDVSKKIPCLWFLKFFNCHVETIITFNAHFRTRSGRLQKKKNLSHPKFHPKFQGSLEFRKMCGGMNNRNLDCPDLLGPAELQSHFCHKSPFTDIKLEMHG